MNIQQHRKRTRELQQQQRIKHFTHCDKCRLRRQGDSDKPFDVAPDHPLYSVLNGRTFEEAIEEAMKMQGAPT